MVCALALGLLALGGCADPPEARVAQAWQAGEAEDLEAFAKVFLPASAELIRGLDTVSTRTRGTLSYAKPFDLLPKGEVVEVVERDNLAVVSVKAKGRSFDVRLLRERGIWYIDAFALPTLWEPMGRGEDT